MEHSRSIFVSSFVSDMKYIATSFFFLKEFGLSEKHLVYVNEWGIRCTGRLLQNSIFGLCMGNSAAFCKKDHCIQRQMLPLFQFSVLTSVFFSCELKKKEKGSKKQALCSLSWLPVPVGWFPWEAGGHAGPAAAVLPGGTTLPPAGARQAGSFQCMGHCWGERCVLPLQAEP